MAGVSGFRARVRRGTRAAFERLREAGRGKSAADADVLAISDLHLGGDLRRGLRHELPPRQDGPLAALLDHYRALEGRRRLVIAGDMVDFIGMTVTPGPDEQVPFAVTAEERLCGLEPEPPKAVWKLERVMERHRLFCEKLARFLAEGHELVVVRGNHDQEWSIPEVRAAFVERLCALAGGSAEEKEALRQRIRFCDWFYLEPGRIYVEHGHLHDEFSATFDTGADGTPRALREPVSTLALRYFGNRHEGLDLDLVDAWTFGDYVKWALDGGRFWRAGIDYLALTARLLTHSVRVSTRTMLRSLKALVKLGRGLAEKDDLGYLGAVLSSVRDDHVHLVKELVALWRPPAEESVLQVAQLLYVDRLLLALGVMAGVAGCAASNAPGSWRAAALVATLAFAAGANAVLSRVRLVDSHPKLRRVAHRMAVIFGVEVVVMGHSHRVVDEPVGDGSRYFNLGTWLSPLAGEGGPGYPHLVVDAQGARLERWPVRSTTVHVA